MKNLFKISTIISTIALVFSVVTVNAATTDVTYSADVTTVKPGDKITITIHASCDEGINCVGTDVDGTTTEVVYDENVLELVEISGKSGFSTLAPEGSKTITLMATGDKTDADVGEIIFKVKEGAASGTTIVKIEGMVLSAMNSDSEFEIPDKSITLTVGNTTGGNTDNPGGNTDNPGGNTDNPGGNTDNPGGNTDNPGGNTDNPGGNTDNPGENTDNPGGNTDNPGGNTDNPGGAGNGSSKGDSTTTGNKLPATGAKTYAIVVAMAVIAVISFAGYKKYSY